MALHDVGSPAPAPTPDDGLPGPGYALDYIQDAVTTYDREWRHTYLNRAAMELAGKPARELIGKSVWEVFPQMVGTRFYLEVHRAAGERARRHFEEHYAQVDRWLEFDAYPTGDGLVVVAREITDAKRQAIENRNRDERLSLALSFGKMGVWEYDLRQDVVRWSPELEAIHGLAPGTFDGKHRSVERLVHPDDLENLRLAYRNAIVWCGVLAHEFRVVWPDGSIHYLYSRGKAVGDDRGQAELLLGVTVEITEQKLAERELHTRLRQLELLSELAGAVSRADDSGEVYQAAVEGLVRAVAADRAGVLIFDADGVMRFKASVGLSAEYRAAVEGHSPWSRGTRDAQPVVVRDARGEPTLAPLAEALAREGIQALAFIPLMGKDGLIGKFMIYHDAPHEFHADEIRVAQTIASHLTFAAERQVAASALRESEERFRAIFAQKEIGITVNGLGGEWLSLNDGACEILGYTKSELRGRTFLEVTHPEDRSTCIEAVRKLQSGQLSTYLAEKRYVRKDGRVIWVRVFAAPVRDREGRLLYFIAMMEDITASVQARSILRESEERFRYLADTAPVMIWMTGSNRLCTFFSKRWLEFTGRTLEQELGSGWLEGVHPRDLKACVGEFSAAFDTQRPFQIEHRMRRADGEYRWLLCTGAPRFTQNNVFEGYVGCSLDITDLKRTQEQVLATQKLESLGVLAGGIAHDFNNLLGSILADAEVLLDELPADERARGGIEQIKTVAIRAAEIVRELMVYAGQETTAFEAVDLSELVAEMLQLLKVSISKRATLAVDLPARLPLVLGSAPQLRQVVLNLITNASEAIGEDGGAISVTVNSVGAQDDSGTDSVRLVVRDTGIGMTPEVQARIFDPFYSTKFAGRGLGLAAVQGIVRGHGGSIHVTSAPGRGSRFEILLPCTSRPEPKGGQDMPVAVARASAGDTVLLVEDEDSLRVAVARMLERNGYSVIEAADGRLATDLYRASHSEIDLVLLDMTLPRMAGNEVLAELRRINPNVAVVLTSAYGQETVVRALADQAPCPYIRKPYPMNELMSLLRDVLRTRLKWRAASRQ
ncbi:MAG TPA: PAS domain S-box protein [Verrucomicrobiae bacterium]|nr:PAS domain S-box protein [Verrucomicrobiae bacterium]